MWYCKVKGVQALVEQALVEQYFTFILCDAVSFVALALLLWLLWQGYGISTQEVKTQESKDAHREWHGKPHPFVVAPSLRSLFHCMRVNTCLRAYMSECLSVGLNVRVWCICIKHRHSDRQTCIYDTCLQWMFVYQTIMHATAKVIRIYVEILQRTLISNVPKHKHKCACNTMHRKTSKNGHAGGSGDEDQRD